MKKCSGCSKIEVFKSVQDTDNIVSLQRPAIVKIEEQINFFALLHGYRDLTVIYYCPFCGRKIF